MFICRCCAVLVSAPCLCTLLLRHILRGIWTLPVDIQHDDGSIRPTYGGVRRPQLLELLGQLLASHGTTVEHACSRSSSLGILLAFPLLTIPRRDGYLRYLLHGRCTGGTGFLRGPANFDGTQPFKLAVTPRFISCGTLQEYGALGNPSATVTIR